jgi:acyl-CoA synthetase (AMP-forming)/AMP-acid ligase II
MKVIDIFDRGVELYPDGACLSDVGQAPRSYRQVQVASKQIAIGLSQCGVNADTKIAVYSPNLARAFECVLGIFRCGAIWVPVNSRNALPENCYVLNNTDVEILFFHNSFRDQLDEIRLTCPKIRLVITIDSEEPNADPSLNKWLERNVDDFAEVASSKDALTAIYSSGGTTGQPKGVMFSNLTWSTMVANFHSSMPCQEKPVHLVVAPMTHGAGAVAMCLMATGAHQVVMKGFDAEQVLQAIEREKVTHIFLPPTAIYMLLSCPSVRQYDYSSLRYFIYAAAPMSADKLCEAMDVFGPVMAQTYGQTEAPMIATFLSPRDHLTAISSARHRLLSCGRAALMSPIDIIDDDGQLQPPNTRGEISIRGDLVMMGYYKNPEATAESRAGERHRTGDIGYKDDEGYLYIVDRKRDMIISGGFNVYPSEIEQVIWGHPAVQDCSVIGAPDDKWGEVVTAIVELRPGTSASAEEIIALCRDRLGSVKAPKHVEFRGQLPRSAVGKVLKRELRAEFWQGRDRVI